MSRNPSAAKRRYRVEVRVTAEQEALIREAADLAQETLTTFILTTATERARRLVDARRTVTLPDETFDRFFATLDEPAQAVPELVALLRAEPLPRE